MMKKRYVIKKEKMIRMVLALIVLSLALTGCAGYNGAEEVTPTMIINTPEPTTAQEVSFTISGSQIMKKTNEQQEVIYDAALHYNDQWTVWTGNLTVDGGCLYFTEGAVFSDGVSCICETEDKGSAYAVVRTDLSGADRTVLVFKDTPSGYWDIALLGERLFYVDGADEIVSVGYVGKDGHKGDVLDFSSVVGEDAVCTNALLDTQDSLLVITADFLMTDGTMQAHTLLVDGDLTVTKQ